MAILGISLALAVPYAIGASSRTSELLNERELR
jgi:hypothetical protein